MALADLLDNQQASAFLLDPSVYKVLEGIAKDHGLPIERSEEFLDLTEAVMDGVMDITQMPMLLASAFGLDQKKSQKLAADIAGYRLLPFEYFLPGLKDQIIAWGGVIDSYSSLRIEKSSGDILTLIKHLAASVGLKLDDVVSKRLLFLLGQFARNEKTEEILKTYFTRSLNIGGLGLNEEQATALLAATLPRVKELTEVAGTKGVEEVSETAPEVKEVVEPVKQELEIAPSHELAAEVPLTNVKMTAPPSLPMAGEGLKMTVRTPELDVNELKTSAKRATVVRKMTETTQERLMAAVMLALTEAGEVLKKTKISDKVFIDLADKAVRGLRDIYQTRDIVERDWQLKGADLAGLMEAVGRGVESYQMSASPGPSLPGGGLKMSDSTTELDDRFTELTDKTDGQVAPAKARLTVGSTVPKTAEGQRKMIDVVSSARLAGPIEQLGKMTPTEFRRLSSSAAEAAQKVDDLLAALQTTSYEERVKGVQAWRESPMNQLYLEIAEEALAQGLALPEVGSRRRAAGKDSLSPAEIKALALLNAKIRF